MTKLFTDADSGLEKSITARMINLIWLYSEILCLLALFVLSVMGTASSVGIFLCAYMVVCALVWIYTNKSKNYDLAALIFSYQINIVLFPMLFVYGGGFVSGAPILLLAGYLVTFMLLRGMRLIVAIMINTLWYVVVLAYGYYNPEKIVSVNNGLVLLINLILCFVIACVIASIALRIYGDIYKNLRISIENSQKVIEDSSSVKGRFLTSMSSELKTPINAILNMTEMLEKGAGGNSLEISTMRTSAFSLLTTIDNVLNYSKLNLGKLELGLHQFYFSKMLQDLFYTIDLELIGKEVPLLIDLDPNIPDVLYGDEDRIRQIFNYVLYNAVQNIDEGRVTLNITYKESEGKKNCITIMVRISDTGVGLTEDEQSAIFNSFEIYDSKKFSQLKKVGLELTICRDILKLMNGNIEINSINGVGTAIDFQFDIFSVEKTPLVKRDKYTNRKVLIYMPKSSRFYYWNELMSDFGIVPEIVNTVSAFEILLRDKIYDLVFVSDYSYPELRDIIGTYKCQDKCYVVANVDAEYGDFDTCRLLRRPLSCINISEAISGTWKEADYKGDDSKSTFVAPSAKVLVADENMINIRVMTGLLEKYEIGAYIATNAKEAFEKCNKTKFDLIFLSHTILEVSEYETLNNIREELGKDYNNTPIICMTAIYGEEMRDDFVRVGYSDYLAIPVRHKYLERILSENLDGELLISAETEKSKEESIIDTEKFAPGLTVEQGLLRTGGDVEVYCAILNTYYQEGQQKILDIIQEHEMGELPMFVINVHAVKGSSASIGGLEVSELFRQLEFAGKDNDLEFIECHLENALDKYRSLLDEIRMYLIANNCLEEEKTAGADAPLEDFDVEQMKVFRQCLDDFETSECENMLEEWIGHNFGPEINNYISEMKRTCDSFDYDRTMEYVDEFIEVFS